MPRLVAVGNTFIDCILMPDASIHPFVCGGNALYMAAGMNLWTTGVGVLSRIGIDYPVQFLDDVTAAGIDISGIKRLPVQHALVSGFQYHEDGSRDYFWPDLEKLHLGKMGGSQTEIIPATKEPEEASDFDPIVADIPDEYWNAQGFGIGSMGAQSQLAFVDAFSSKNKMITWDSPDPNGSEAMIIPWISKATAFIPSFEEMDWFFNSHNYQKEIEYLATLGSQVVGLKLGSQGSLMMDVRNQHLWHIPPLGLTVKDPTGAGDAYCGGFLAGYLETGDVLQAALMATVSSSIVIEEFDVRYVFRFGRKDALERLKTLRSMVKQIV